MTLPQLKKVVAKEFCFGSQDWWLEKIDSWPKNEWFTSTGDDYTALIDMAHLHFCDFMREPIWQKGRYKGDKISFRIRIDEN